MVIYLYFLKSVLQEHTIFLEEILLILYSTNNTNER